MMGEVVLIAGPTASGKSSLALSLAAEKPSVIINADSIQVYDGLRIITARPSVADTQAAPHHLFGYINPKADYSIANWLDDAAHEIEKAKLAGMRAIVVGGTGMYFSALLNGLSRIPPIRPDIRKEWREFKDDPQGILHSKLQELDPQMAVKLKPSDQQRIRRALEVITSTGHSLIEWQNLQEPGVLANNPDISKILIMPDRPELHQRIHDRFDQMVDLGAVEEVEAFLKLGVDPSRTAMKAIGIPQFGAYLAGEVSLDEAIEKSKTATRRYCKRQYTWFNNQFDDSWKLTL